MRNARPDWHEIPSVSRMQARLIGILVQYVFADYPFCLINIIDKYTILTSVNIVRGICSEPADIELSRFESELQSSELVFSERSTFRWDRP